MVNDTKPDIIILSGDLIDKDTKLTDDVANDISTTLKKIKTKCWNVRYFGKS